MTTTLERPRPAAPTTPQARPPLRARVREVVRARRHGLAYLLPLLTVALVASRVGFAGSPQRIDDEGTYTAQAWAVQNLGTLGHYTYWYDHPPLGWVQMAGWTWLTDAFARYDDAVVAGREAMLVAHLVTVVLLWVLGRRLGLGRPAAAAAVLVYALSPLAIQFTRTVYLDNVATPWALGAFVLALVQRRQLAAFTGAAACLAVAVLSKETYLLLAPFLAWQMWRSAHPSTRRYTLSVAASVFVLTGVGYLLYAGVKGELMPGEDRVSLWEGITFQLVDRGASGSVLDASSQAGRSVRVWLTLDPVLPVAAALAAVVGLAVRRLRVIAALLVFLFAVVFKPGYLPVPQVIVMLPFAALLVAGVAEAGLRRWRRRERGSRTLAVTTGLAAVTAVAVAVPLWAVQLRGLWLADLDRPLREAEAWIDANVDRDQRILTDDALWVDLVRAGFDRDDVVWYYKADTDPAVAALAPNGWSDYDYLVLTQAVRLSAYSAPTVDQALDNATRSAVFGDGDNRVEVYRVHDVGADAYAQAEQRDADARAVAGQSLAGNPRLDLSAAAADDLRQGRVDSRLVSLLALVAGVERDAEAAPVGVEEFPVVDGERDQMPVRTVVLDAVTSDVADLVRDQVGPFRPDRLEREGDRLLIRFDPAEVDDILPAPAGS